MHIKISEIAFLKYLKCIWSNCKFSSGQLLHMNNIRYLLFPVLESTVWYAMTQRPRINMVKGWESRKLSNVYILFLPEKGGLKTSSGVMLFTPFDVS